MSQFFNPTTQRVQPLRQEGVVDTIRDWNIVGYSFENNTAHSVSTLTITAAATGAGTATFTVTVNPASQAFFGQNTRTISVPLLAGDSVTVVAAKLRAALSADLLLSAYYNITVAGAAVSLLPKQLQDPNANITLYTIAAPGTTGITATGFVGAVPIVNPLARVGRLVYTPSAASGPSVVRVIEPGATGVLRGFTAWCPDVEYDDVNKADNLRPFWRHDVMDRGVINLDAVTSGQAYGGTSAATLFVYTTGVNAGKVRIGTDAGAVALTAANFPNLVNLAGCVINTFEPSLGSNTITKFAVEIN